MKYVDALRTFFHACNEKYQALRRGIKRYWPSYDEVNATHQPAWLYWFRHQWFIYPIFLVLLPTLSVFGLQWGAHADGLVEGATLSGFGDFFNHTYTESLFQTPHLLILNIALLALFYLSLIFILNRFWIASALYSSIIIIWMIANRIMVSLRHEAVTPNDLSTGLTVGGSHMSSFIAGDNKVLVNTGVSLVITALFVCIFCRLLFGKGRVLWFKNLHIHIPLRIITACIPSIALVAFSVNLSTINSWAYNFSRQMGDSPAMWSTLTDAHNNGAALSFARFTHTNVMDKPAHYSQKAMQAIYRKYNALAQQINSQRKAKLTDQSVIMVLSESFSDPTRIPGISFNQDPIPFIRQLKNDTTSGLMLSSGYGGGTANLEYQALTGLSTALFAPSVITPYLQVVLKQRNAFSFNQQWNIAAEVPTREAMTKHKSSEGSFAVHSYTPAIYSRGTVFSQHFLFNHFYTTGGPDYVSQTGYVGNNPTVSDESSYLEVTKKLKALPDNQNVFVQLSTIQNHMPYSGWYPNNPFAVSGDIGSDDPTAINTYAQGVNYSDQATQKWLSDLDKLKRPVTVIWYGDHLPGIYPAQIGNPDNIISLHETDYFIWSNAAARAQGDAIKLSDDAAFTSPNYLMAQATEHMNAKVSPYLAFLTQAHSKIAAIEPTLQQTIDFSLNTDLQPNTYLDPSGQQIASSNLSADQKAILNDYKLIQYDMTVGKNYLAKEGWTELPK